MGEYLIILGYSINFDRDCIDCRLLFCGCGTLIKNIYNYNLNHKKNNYYVVLLIFQKYP